MRDRNGLQTLVHAEIKATFGLSAQPAVRVLKKVVDACSALVARRHLACKARKAAVPFLEVDAACTSRHCPRCGHTERANRPDRDHFS